VVCVTPAFGALRYERGSSLLAPVRAFEGFTEHDDPHGDGDVRCLWKIGDAEMMSCDPADAAGTTRVLTVMRADEY
jgi:hypothetical protein